MGDPNTAQLRLPLLGLGGASFGRPYRNSLPNDEAIEESYESAWAGGIRFFDTAPLYGTGLGERRLGEWLRGRSRDAYYLSTKVGSYGGRTPHFDYSYDKTLESVATSMKRLGTERLDVVFIHDIDPHTHGATEWKNRFWEAMEGAYPALSRLKSEGVIGALGVGVNSCNVCEECLVAGDFDIFMLAGRLTLLDQSATRSLIPRCLSKGVAIVAAAPFNSGILAAGSRSMASYKETRPSLDVIRKVKNLEDLCGEFEVSLGALAVQFPLQQPVVASVVPGASNPSQIQEICRWFAEDIPAALWSRLHLDSEFAGCGK